MGRANGWSDYYKDSARKHKVISALMGTAAIFSDVELFIHNMANHHAASTLCTLTSIMLISSAILAASRAKDCEKLYNKIQGFPALGAL